jgi:hypothetical protein
MNSDWKAFLERQGATLSDGGEVSFGGTAAEIDAARSSTVAVPLTHLGLIRATGEEAAGFLHNLLTNDVNHLRPGQVQHNSLCSAKGRMMASFLIWREGADYLLQLSQDLHAGVLRKLGMYVLRSKVKLADASADLAVVGVAGAGIQPLVAGLGIDIAENMRSAPFAGGTAIRLDARRYLLALKTDAAPAVWQRIVPTATPTGTAVWRWLEIQAGVPRITAATQEEFVPQMANFELIGGVSFQKGCYPGQEIVARTQYLGKLKRRMYLAHLPVEASAGAQLYSAELAEQSCGMVVDAVPAPGGGSDLLAVVQIGSAEAGDVRLGSADGPRLEFRPLPYALG